MTFKLIVISLPKAIPNETELITSLFKAGLKIFHLRKPGMSKARMKKIIAAIPAKFHTRIVIHSHYSLLKEFPLKGIHLPDKEKRSVKERVKGKTFSSSFHRLFDTFITSMMFDYQFIGPVYDSISKRGYKKKYSAKELEVFIRFRKQLPSQRAKLIALGGINEKNILQVKKEGFDGAAVLGAIWLSKDPVKSFKRIRNKLD